MHKERHPPSRTDLGGDIYLGKNRVAIAREYSRNYKRMLEIVEEMTSLNMDLIKRDADF